MKQHQIIESKKLAEKMILRLAADMWKLKQKPKLSREECKELQRLRCSYILAKNCK